MLRHCRGLFRGSRRRPDARERIDRGGRGLRFVAEPLQHIVAAGTSRTRDGTSRFAMHLGLLLLLGGFLLERGEVAGESRRLGAQIVELVLTFAITLRERNIVVGDLGSRLGFLDRLLDVYDGLAGF